MRYEVTVTSVPEHLLAAARRRTTRSRISQEIGTLLGAPWALIREHPELRNESHNVAVYRDLCGEGSIEVGVQVVRRFEPTETVVCSSTPAGTVATTTHFGPYSELGPAHEAVIAWCRENGRGLEGLFWEIYGHWNDDLARLQTDVFYLLK